STLRNNGIPWDLDVQLLISSAKWLQLHGLKKNKLTFPQILSQIGFQHKEDYVSILGKLVASRYANGLYHQCITTPDGNQTWRWKCDGVGLFCHCRALETCQMWQNH
uniref:Uncharacterized protein n=1 Tax=Salvator merianae TaxID=96440 RepID=A0A8D0KNF4_SALMN